MSSAATNRSPSRRKSSVRMRWCFRTTAACLGFGLFAALELLCAVAGWGDRRFDEDPFVEFVSIRPLFEKSADEQTYVTSPARRRYFREVSFDARKPDNEFRIFVFGGSTVQGNPFSLETSFPTYLQTALKTAEPTRQWKVVNCGGVSYASYRLLPVMQECFAYQPDLFIFCGGHNEFLEDVSYDSVRKSPALVRTVFEALNQSRAFRVFRQQLLAVQQRYSAAGTGPSPATGTDSVSSPRPLLPPDVDTLLDHDGGLEAYHRDDHHAGMVAEHFEYNLECMATLCRDQRLPLLVMLPPSNLSDCPPFKSEFSEDVSAADRAHITQLLVSARSVVGEDLERAIKLARLATEIDSRYPLAWYERGHLHLSARQFEEAEFCLRKARDEDVCPLRMTTPLEQAMKRVVQKFRLPFLDAHEQLRETCRNQIVGENVLVDHVHPSFRGHEDLAIAITDWMISAGMTRVRCADWKAETRTECGRQLQALDNLYFLRGRRALENLRLWAAGRSGGPPLLSNR